VVAFEPNGDNKLDMVARGRRETTLPIKWIAARLQLGTLMGRNVMLRVWMRAQDAAAATQQAYSNSRSRWH
jgi:hypothetical protein